MEKETLKIVESLLSEYNRLKFTNQNTNTIRNELKLIFKKLKLEGCDCNVINLMETWVYKTKLKIEREKNNNKND